MFRIGIGYDSHRLVIGRDFYLGGIKIPFEKGSLGHSDGDVLIHAIIDALLGALGLGDSGTHFSDTDPQYKDIKSSLLLQETYHMITALKWKIVNIDTNIILETPKLGKYKDEMKQNIATILNIEKECISIKAKTNEGMDAIGQGECVAAQVVALLEKNC